MNYDVGVFDKYRTISPDESSFLVLTADAAETTAFLARTSGLDDAHRNAYRTLINGVVSDGIWTKLDALYIRATQDSATALLNLVSTNYATTIVGSPVFTVDRGFSGTDLATAVHYLNTNFNPTSGSPKYIRDSAHLSVWGVADVTPVNGGAAIGCVNGALLSANILPKFTDGKEYFRINEVTGTAGVVNADATGHYLSNRSGSSAQQGYRNAVNQGIVAGTSAAISNANGNYYELARNSIGVGPTSGTPQTIAASSIGGNLTAAEVTLFYNRLWTYLVTVGAA